MVAIPYFTLSRTGDKIPAIAMGSGTAHQIKKRKENEAPTETVTEDLVNIIVQSIDYAGFNHIDTAEVYTTEIEVGEALKRTKIDRSKIWVTSKYDAGWNKNSPASTPSGPYEALTNGLKKMELKYVDLYLIHSPFFDPEISYITLQEAWRQMEKLVEEGLAKNIGVSNFDEKNLKEIFKMAKIKPQVNQIEYNLYLQNQSPGIVKFCKENDILVEAFSPLTPIIPSRIPNGGPLAPLIDELSEKYKVSKNQLILRWVYQSGVLPITTSSNKDRLKDSLAIFEFEIEQDDFDSLAKIGATYHHRNFFIDFFDGASS